MRPILVTAYLAAAAMRAYAQPSAQHLEFEAASVKLNAEAANSGGRATMSETPVRLTMRSMALRQMIAWAYRSQKFLIFGPASLDSDRYDIDATSPASADGEQHRTMMKNLLGDRFKLTLHRETREMPAYVLSVAKAGLKLKESDGNGERAADAGGRELIHLKSATIEQFVERIVDPLRSPVIDATGLHGLYDFKLDVIPYISGEPKREELAYILSVAMQEQLGLKLDSRKAPLEVLVIDSVKRPSEN